MPTLSLILAVDTLGHCYASITQSTTNSRMFKMYLTHLAKSLDKDRPGWREDTILLLDGATYHTCDETLVHMKQLQLPVMFLGPASYNVAPCELMFAHLKAVHLNPEGLPSGK